jgi:hypothetical protein
MNILDNRKNYSVYGRHTYQNGILYLAFSASYVELEFLGDKLTAEMISERCPNEEGFEAWVGVFIDDMDKPVTRIKLEQGMKEYILFEDKACGRKKHRVRIMKYSEEAFSTVGIVSIDIGDGEVKTASYSDRKLIEFIGDSITCGYGIEGSFNVDTFKTSQENPWEAYACKTARKLGMDYGLVSWSGNGIISYWVEDWINEPKIEGPLMPDLYEYADLELETRLNVKDYTFWKPEKKPDYVVLHLGTNDASYTREIEERNKIFEDEYFKFLNKIRSINPNAPIICMLGIMDRRLNASASKAVRRMNEMGDDKVYFIDMQVQDERDGLGTDSHPSAVTHEKMSDMLAGFIQKI